MAYTPELSQKSSGMLRRMAWAGKIPMTRAIEELINFLPVICVPEKVCEACKDRSFCPSCGFSQNNKGGETAKQQKRGPGRRTGDALGYAITQPEPDIHLPYKKRKGEIL